MRCLSCNVALTDFEISRKSAISGDHIDLCNKCFHPIRDSVDTVENFVAYNPEVDDLDTALDNGDQYGDGYPPDSDEELDPE